MKTKMTNYDLATLDILGAVEMLDTFYRNDPRYAISQIRGPKGIELIFDKDLKDIEAKLNGHGPINRFMWHLSVRKLIVVDSRHIYVLTPQGKEELEKLRLQSYEENDRMLKEKNK